MSKIVFVVLAVCLAQSYAEKCNDICTREYKPVCGVDQTGNQRTFSNPCLFELEDCNNRGAGWKVLSNDECQEPKVEKCKQFCTYEYRPVCAVDNTGNTKTFGNKCTFEVEECQNRAAGWRVLANHECESIVKQAEPVCKQFCTYEYQPVCGMDQTGNLRTFGNKCTFEAEECNNRGAGWRLLAEEECSDDLLDELDNCPKFCTYEYMPICGVDNFGNQRTFGNKCGFQMEQCHNRGAGWKVLMNDECQPIVQKLLKQAEPSCGGLCTREYNPVCGQDNTGNMRTFSNRCMFNLEECENRGAGWRMVKNDEC